MPSEPRATDEAVFDHTIPRYLSTGRAQSAHTSDTAAPDYSRSAGHGANFFPLAQAPLMRKLRGTEGSSGRSPEALSPAAQWWAVEGVWFPTALASHYPGTHPWQPERFRETSGRLSQSLPRALNPRSSQHLHHKGGVVLHYFEPYRV